MIYLDNNATTRPAPEVVAVMERAMREHWANPSSVHREGIKVRQQIELAREQVCKIIGCKSSELVFTSGGTESCNLAIRGSSSGTGVSPVRKADGHTRAGRACHPVLIADKLEHSAVRETAEVLSKGNTEVVWLNVDHNGLIDLEHLRAVLSDRTADNVHVSIMWANNETGVIQPVEQIAELCHAHRVRLHVDGTQYVGKMPVNVADLPIDLLSFSAHKFHGPKGIGGLYVRSGVKLEPQITGGPQERERRGGTENVPGIIGMGEAARLASEWLKANSRDALAHSRDQFEQAILKVTPDAIVNGVGAPRLWNTTNIAFPNLEAEAILLMLSERGVCASAGAACSSGSLDPSPVLLAMGVPEESANGSIRFSISRETTQGELNEALGIITSTIERLRSNVAV